MAKKPDEPKGFPLWQSTFSDLMNLLVCFFVLLFSMSSVDAAKFEQIAASFSKTFRIFTNGSTAIGEGNLVGNGISQLNNLNDYINNVGFISQDDAERQGEEGEEDNLQQKIEEEGLEQSEKMAEKIEEALEELNLEADVTMDVTAQFVQLTMRGSLLFDSGKAELKEEAYSVLDRVGVILERYAAGTIEIEGHTDNIPIHTAKFDSNDELSSSRAISVFKYLVNTTALDPAHIKHSGRGEYVPIADNSTKEGRALNRRVEIRIYNEIASTIDGTNDSSEPVSEGGENTGDTENTGDAENTGDMENAGGDAENMGEAGQGENAGENAGDAPEGAAENSPEGQEQNLQGGNGE